MRNSIAARRVTSGATASSRRLHSLLIAAAAGVLLTADPHAQWAPAAIAAPTHPTVSNVNTQVVGSTTLSSSSRLTVGWSAPAGVAVDHYEVRATEAGLLTTFTASASATSLTLTGLKSSTTYSVVVRSCDNAICTQSGDTAAVSGTTSAEYWQVQGTGAAATTATIVVSQSQSSGSVMSWPVLYGAEAGSSLSGKVRLYFKGGVGGLNTSVALSGTATAAPASVSSFTQDTAYGLKSPSESTGYITSDVSAPQGVPRSVGGTPHVRLFFKAVGGSGANGKNRLFYLDSQDGLTGQDFHPGAPTLVSSSADWTTASPTIALGVTGDPTPSDSGLLQVRQTKIGLPLLTNWLWNDAPGTFMVITGQDNCGQTTDGLFYGQWDGTMWNVTKDANNCPRPLVRYAHGPILLHRGGTRFKLYYEDRVTDMNETNKPTRLLYGDGALTGASSLEFGDWEAQSVAREFHFLWPDGSLVNVADESGFGDHSIFYPTTDPDVQVMYINLTGFDGPRPIPSRGIGMAVLINDLCPDYGSAVRSVNACVPTITTQPANATTTSGSSATFSVMATGSPTPTYQWQISTNGGATWTALANTSTYSGVTTPTLTVTSTRAAMSTYQYRAVASNTFSSTTATSSAAILTVNGALTATPLAMRFGATVSGTALQVVTSTQTATIAFDGAATAWTAVSNQAWLKITGGAGSAAGTFTAQVDTSAVPAGSTALSATITITAAATTTIPVTLTVIPTTTPAVPIGSFDTPVAAASVAGSIPVTGWALDDIEVTRVEIWRDKVTGETTPVYPGPGLGTGKVFIANAFFINGARPDIETTYASYPLAYRAGWGYLLLTHGLWNQGNGPFTLHAFAYDRDGHSVSLGSRAITASNATAVKPFGGLDTPAYGQTVSASFWNFGWALTPNATPRCTIGVNGVRMAIDSGPLVPVTFGALRTDIAAAFPGFSNGTGAGGAYYLDTSALSTGTHQIGWYVVDDCGRADGIGSRFFTVVNSGATVPNDPVNHRRHFGAQEDGRRTADDPIEVRRGANTTAVYPNPSGERVVAIGQSERVEVHLPAVDGGSYTGHQVVNGERRALPMGSSLDAAQGIFYWQPAAGFLGAHALEFVTPGGTAVRVRAVVGTAVQAVIDNPTAGSVSSSFMVEGWAIDLGASQGTGIDTVHVWAYPAGGGAPRFLGIAAYGGTRPDVGALFGDMFTGASYRLAVDHLPPGTYDLVVYPHSAVAGDFSGAKVVRVTAP